MNPKEIAGFKAAEFVENGMILGLGTGSTVHYTLMRLCELVKEGLRIKGIPTSKKTEEIARKYGIPITSFDEYSQLDLTIDGADEVDENFNMIKGGGGALLREKIVARASKKYIVVIDSSKLVKKLGEKSPLPVEVLPFGWKVTKKYLEKLGFEVTIREKENKYFVTDNENYILDCNLSNIPKIKTKAKIKDKLGISSDIELLDYQINNIPGVIQNGLFLNIADIIIIGKEQGYEIRERS